MPPSDAVFCSTSFLDCFGNIDVGLWNHRGVQQLSNARQTPVSRKSPTPEETELPDAADGDRQAAARQVLAERLSVAPDSLEFVSEEAVQWSDTSLGCPEPDKAYATVIVPGYRITFRHADGQYEVHTAEETGDYPPVSCEGG